MPQETNLNVSPYFDDFNSENEYYKVLFKPGYPIQARELTTIQSILQNQIEQYGKNIFKEGSVVIPGQLKYENPFYAVEIEESYNGILVSEYFDQLVGKKITGSSSGVTAEIVYLLKNTESERGNHTLYVKYIESGGANFENKRFQNSETLILQTSFSYNGLIFAEGQGFCNTISSNAISEGSAASIANGIYFVRGFFASVRSQTIILDQYGNAPSYKVGLNIIEKIVTSDEDGDLFDNAQGFSNYAAPGADRFKIELELSKRTLDDTDTQNFVEILRITNGVPEFFDKNPQYNLIRDELARRTSETSGDYIVKPFTLSIRDSLNDRVLNKGIFFKDQLTVEGNTPSDDLMIYEINPGKAYVNGYEAETISTKLLDVPKARTTSTINDRVLTLNSGVLFVANNGYGSPRVGLGTTSIVKLMDSRIGVNRHEASGTEIGSARIYDFVPESDYIDQTSRLHVRLIDIETYTSIQLTQEITLNAPAVIKGKRSRATGYLRQNVSDSKTLNLYGVSGNFLKNEPISINEIDNTRLIVSVENYNLSDVKSLYSRVGLSTFNCDIVLDNKSYILPPSTNFNINNGVVFAGADKNFIRRIKVGDIVSYASTTYGDPIYNKVVSVGSGGTNFSISGITTVLGVCNGKLPSGSFNTTNLFKITGNITNVDSSLLTFFDRKNINYVNILETEILQRRSFENCVISSDYSLTINIDPSDTNAYFAEFDEDRFVITYTDGTVEPMRFDKYSRNPNNAKELTFNGLSKNSGTASIIATIVNRLPNEKKKNLSKVSNLIVSNSKFISSGIGTTTFNDGLTYSNVYGTRVQDQEICLNVPDVVRVLAVYESIGIQDPELPYLQLTSFTGNFNNTQDYNEGEKIFGKTSGSAAIIVKIKDSDKIEYVYLNEIPFQLGEIIEGEDSKTNSIITFRSIGSKNVTQNFILDNGQRDHFYDYSRIVRKPEVIEPSRKLRIIFQNYVINPNDTGEFITANSYPSDGFKHDVSVYENSRLTDAIDIRPRVSPYKLSSVSPFEFNGRNFASDGQYSKYIIAPGEDLRVSYSYYQGRIDLISLNSDGKFEVIPGIPSDNPKPPANKNNTLDIAHVSVPPYVYNVKNVEYEMIKHRRYRMSDISLLEDRIDRVEKYTTLSMLESKTENFQIRDAETGLDRFKCGFFVDNFSNHDYHDVSNPYFRAAIDDTSNTLRPSHYTTSIDLQLGSEAISGVSQTYSPNVAHNFVTDLGSSGIKKTGDLVTLNYNEVLYFEQIYASKTENITPFLIRFWQGSIEMRPSIDTWIDERTETTTRFNDVNISTGALLGSSSNTTITLNGEVFSDFSTPQTGLVSSSYDWIFNARNWVTNVVYNGRNPSNIFNGISGALTVNANNNSILSLQVNKLSANATTFSQIRSLLPPDIAEQFISQIRQKNGNALASIQFSPNSSLPSSLLASGIPVTGTSRQLVSTSNNINSFRTEATSIKYLRSRNIEFDVSSLKPFTKFYPFFGGVSVKDYIVPKLLEIEMISGAFIPGEKVESVSTAATSKLIFRLCNANHKFGPPTSPTQVFDYNPYDKQLIPTSYSQSSRFLNVDTTSLQLPSEVDFYGKASIGMVLRGKTSTAVARITDIRLISDNQGKLIGSLFIPSPSVSSNPKWTNGVNTFTVTDVPTLSGNSSATVGSNANESSAESNFTSNGTETATFINVTTTRNIRIIPTTNQNARIFETRDPLAQSFYVKENSGIFLTSVEVFFASKDSQVPVTLQIRPIISGIPSNIVVPFSEVTLSPNSIATSPNGSVGTKFTFPSPVYLNGPQQQEVRNGSTGSQQTSEYAIVLLSDSTNYTVFISEIGQNDILNSNVKISQQPTLGSLFKSQNGTVWTPAQLEDLKYRLYRADFTGNGLVRFYNPKLSVGNNKVTVTNENNFVTLSKRVIVGLGSTGYDYSKIVPGITIENDGATGTLIGIAGSITVGAGFTISNVGSGYTAGTFNSINLITETGYGFGAVADIVTSTNSGVGIISSVTITNGGAGYQIGDSLIVPEIGKGVGYGGKLTVTSIGSSNTFILDNVQGNFTSGISTLNYINSSGITTYVGVGVTISSVANDQYYTGQHMKVYQVNHGMHSSENYVKISKFRPDITSINSRTISTIDDFSDSIPIQPGTGIGFTQFEGRTVDSSNIGYVIIGDEVIGYTDVVNDTLISDSTLLRGVDSTEKQSYDVGTILYKYEFQGVSLRRINKIHNLSLVDESKHPKDLNYYHIKIEMGEEDYANIGIGYDRSDDLSFNKTIQSGNPGTNITNNIQYEVLTPSIGHLVFPGTNLIPRIRTFTGTSIGGNEESFVDAGYENISLNSSYFFNSPRLICSDVNEMRFIKDSPGNRSFTLEMALSSSDSKISPVIDTSLCSIILTSNLINNPIGINNDTGYADDDSVRSLSKDKHSVVYLSKPVRLNLSANSIKVLLSASITDVSDIRVLYQAYRSDSSNPPNSFDLFPGWSNYQTDSQGIRRVVDFTQNNGSPDNKLVKDSDTSFRDYEFSIDDIDDFDVFVIKIVMASSNQAKPPLIKDLRAIATVKPRLGA